MSEHLAPIFLCTFYILNLENTPDPLFCLFLRVLVEMMACLVPLARRCVSDPSKPSLIHRSVSYRTYCISFCDSNLKADMQVSPLSTGACWSCWSSRFPRISRSQGLRSFWLLKDSRDINHHSVHKLSTLPSCLYSNQSHQSLS